MTEKIFKDIDEKLVSGDPFEPELQRLMEFKVRKVLLVASLWDYFMLEEDGRLIDLLGEAYKEYDLGYVPLLHRVDGGKAALEEIENDEFDLVITVMRIKDMEPYKLAQRIKRIQSDLPVVLLAYNTPELEVMIQREENRVFERIFVWQGDGNILIGIIKSIEDQRNAENDTELAGVQHILLIEDSIHFYSKYLYILYEELWLKIRHLLKENISYTLRKSRQRKRPRILHAINFEEGLDYYN
ncbi:MAG: response regulator, partial [Acidobacteria bacterium]|nr:response regulator [Acidobacteriota bacterium]